MTRAKDEPLIVPGMIVTLPSGGPHMTVIGTDPDTGWLCCAWYEEAQHQHKSINFPEAALEIVATHQPGAPVD